MIVRIAKLSERIQIVGKGMVNIWIRGFETLQLVWCGLKKKISRYYEVLPVT